MSNTMVTTPMTPTAAPVANTAHPQEHHAVHTQEHQPPGLMCALSTPRDTPQQQQQQQEQQQPGGHREQRSTKSRRRRGGGRGGRGGRGGDGGNASPAAPSLAQRGAGKGKWKRPSPRDMARVLSELLHEPKQGLLQRVVRIATPKVAWDVLEETLRVEQSGGQHVNAVGSGRPEAFLVSDVTNQQPRPRRRTTGGVFFTLLKDHVSREAYQEIYAIENQRKKEIKKKVRYRRKQQMETVINGLGFEEIQLRGKDDDAGDHGGSDGNENGNSNDSGQFGDDRDMEMEEGEEGEAMRDDAGQAL